MAPIERDLLDGPLVDDLADRHRCRLHDRGRGVDRERFADLDILRRCLSHGDRQVLDYLGLEARRLDFKLIGAGGEGHDLVISGSSGDRAPFQSRRLVGCHDRGARDGAARGI